MKNFIISIAIILLGLSTGYLIQIIEKSGKFKLPIDYDRLPRILQKFALLIFNPIALIGALWIVQLESIRLVILPILGIIAIVLGGLLAGLFGKAQHMIKHQLGAYIIAGSFTNIGLIGGLICYLFFGEIGYAFVPLYKLFEEVLYYGVGFPLAKSYSTSATEKSTLKERFSKVFTDVFIRVAIFSILIGIILNILGIKRPAIYSNINSIVIPLASFLLLTSIGLNLRFSKMKSYIKPSIFIVIIKMMIIPTTITILGIVLGLGEISGGLPLKVVIVLSSMPTGFIALVPPSIYKLDTDLANTVWFSTTLSLLVVIPWLSFITGLV